MPTHSILPNSHAAHVRPPTCPPGPSQLPQLGCGLREQLVAGGGWRAPFTATALDHCELLELPVAAWQGVVANHADVADELAAEADR